MRRFNRSKLLNYTARAAIIAALFAIYYFTANALTGFSCFFMITLGIPCPGCGITRAMVSALKLEFASAFYYHPLFWLVPFLAVAVILQLHCTDPKKEKRYNIMIWTMGGIFLGVYILRMILLFPRTDPMEYNSGGMLPALFRMIFSKN